MFKVLSYCIALGLTLSAGATLLPEEQVIENVKSIIVQGASQSIMEQNIKAAGGEVLHSFSVIEAVSASLTPQQMEQIKLSHPSIRFFTDTDVEISSTIKKRKSADSIYPGDYKNNVVGEMSNSIVLDRQKPLQNDLSVNTVS